MQYRLLKALALAVFACAIVAGPASAAPSWAPASSATIHPGVQTFTDGAQCTANFVFYDALQRLPRPGRALLRHRRGDRHQRLHQRLAADRHAGRHTAASKPGTHGLQLVADDAVQRRGERRHLRVQRPRAGQDRPGRRRQGQPVDPVLGRPDRGQHRRHRGRRQGLLATATPSCAAASPSSAPSRARASATTATAGATRSTRSRPASPATPARPS